MPSSCLVLLSGLKSELDRYIILSGESNMELWNMDKLECKKINASFPLSHIFLIIIGSYNKLFLGLIFWRLVRKREFLSETLMVKLCS